MANKYRGEARLMVGDKEFLLVYDCNALCALEQEVNMPFAAFAEKTAKGSVGFIGARALLWAGLLNRHGSTTLTRAGELLTEIGIQVALETCWGALRQCFPEVREGNETAAVGTGNAS